ncbi:MAG: hypothetical protein JSW52_01780 [Candidatus Coatesbacteria bacterium]|nr:MAG: hypothetical protein JSW52_01780 [Candidatus Coatesbacteria bacterium]
MIWEIAAGMVGAAAYYLLRYDPRRDFNFPEYLRFEASALIKGVAGFLLIWGAWSALNCFDFVPVALPEMNPAVALVVGFAAKKAVDYTVGRLDRLNGS